MGKIRLGLFLLFVLTIAGACVIGRPTPEQLAVADCGPYPDDWETIVKGYYSRVLFDPYSAVYQFSGLPQRGWAAAPRMGGGPLEELLGGYAPVFGWEVQGLVNAKNRFGAYVGARPFIVLIRNGQVVNAVGP